LVYLAVKRVFHLNQKKKIILGSLLSAFLLSFSLLNIQFSQQIRPHVAVSFFILLSFYFYLITLEKKTIGSYLILAVSCGLAASVLISGFFTFVFLILANYFIAFQSSKLRLFDLIKSFFSRRFLAGLGIFSAVIFIFYPFFFFSSLSERFYFFEQGEGLFISLGSSPFPIANLGLGFFTILKGLIFQEPALGILLIFFLFFYFFKRKPIDSKNFYYKQSLIGWWSFVASYALIFGLIDNGDRYRGLSPLVVFLCLGLGILFIRVFDNLSKYKKISLLLISILLLFEFTQAWRLVELISKPYTAEIATEWIEKNISPKETIVYQGFLPELIPDKESIKRNSDLSGLLGYRNQYLLSLEPEEYPLESRPMINFSYLLKYQDNDIPRTLEYLKDIKPGYLVSSLHLLEEEKNILPIYQIAEKQGYLIKSFSPFSQPNRRALTFPSGMNNPIIDLWLAEYLGPKVDIYKLDWNNE
ncbi:glycosyltransferase family 39 protein, partial [Patescibacteria group bacterium]|nr:glycosyltransferase family 39 protein [Patescibacteria group bacterium]